MQNNSKLNKIKGQKITGAGNKSVLKGQMISIININRYRNDLSLFLLKCSDYTTFQKHDYSRNLKLHAPGLSAVTSIKYKFRGWQKHTIFFAIFIRLENKCFL